MGRSLTRVLGEHCRAERHWVGAMCVLQTLGCNVCSLPTSLLLLSFPCGHTYAWNAGHDDWRDQYHGQKTTHQQGMWLAMDTEGQVHTFTLPTTPPVFCISVVWNPNKCFAFRSSPLNALNIYCESLFCDTYSQQFWTRKYTQFRDVKTTLRVFL